MKLGKHYTRAIIRQHLSNDNKPSYGASTEYQRNQKHSRSFCPVSSAFASSSARSIAFLLTSACLIRSVLYNFSFNLHILSSSIFLSKAFDDGFVTCLKCFEDNHSELIVTDAIPFLLLQDCRTLVTESFANQSLYSHLPPSQNPVEAAPISDWRYQHFFWHLQRLP
jgi:hypothetical protein